MIDPNALTLVQRLRIRKPLQATGLLATPDQSWRHLWPSLAHEERRPRDTRTITEMSVHHSYAEAYAELKAQRTRQQSRAA